MGDLYLEKIVRRAPTIKDSLLKVLILFAAVGLSYGIMSVVYADPEGPLIQYAQLFLMLVVGILIGAYYLAIQLNVEHEYIVTNGEIDIDRIIAKRRRKRLCTIPPLDVEIMAPYTDEYKHYYDKNGDFAHTYDTTASKYSKNRWLIVAATKKYGRVRVLFEPTDRMVEHMREYMPRKVHLPENFVLPSQRQAGRSEDDAEA